MSEQKLLEKPKRTIPGDPFKTFYYNRSLRNIYISQTDMFLFASFPLRSGHFDMWLFILFFQL